MAGCGGKKKKMAYGGKVKKMQEGGLTADNTQAEIQKLDRQLAMLKRQAAAQAQANPQRSRLGGAPGAMPALGGPQSMANLGGMKKGGKVKKMRKGGMTEEDKKTFGETEMDQAPPPNFKKSKPKKPVPKDNPGLKKLPTEVRNKMGYMKKGGSVKCKRDGICVRGKTKGRMV